MEPTLNCAHHGRCAAHVDLVESLRQAADIIDFARNGGKLARDTVIIVHAYRKLLEKVEKDLTYRELLSMTTPSAPATRTPARIPLH